MASTEGQKKQLALVFGNLPTVEEIDQFRLIRDTYDVTVISSESICGYLTQTSYFQDLRCIALPDHSENTTYLPGLERILSGFDVVIVKERLGLYSYQAVKAKWRNRFRLVVWIDNVTPFPAEDLNQLRTIRTETTNAADAFIVQSEGARNALLIEGVEPQRILTFKPWVERRIERTGATRAAALKKLGLSDTDFVIAHFGQIEWEEGLFDLVHGISMIGGIDKTLADRVKMVFCGIGSFSTEIRDRLVMLGLDRSATYVAPSREAFGTILQACDSIYYANNPARDRIEGEPYRLVTAMANRIPVIASRGPLVEELIGKHRIDFCTGSPMSLAKAIRKVAGAKALTNSVCDKNFKVFTDTMNEELATKSMHAMFGNILQTAPSVDVSSLDHQVHEVEALVNTKQYLAAIDHIESVFKLKDIPVHHKANLYRLIGDCFTKLGDYESGKTSYTQAIELDQYAYKAHVGLGTVGLTTQKFDIAVIHFQKAVSLAPQDEMANLGLGLAFQGMEEFEEAGRWVNKSLDCNPENTAALYTIVQLASARNKFQDAETALTNYVNIHPHDHNMVFTLAGILHRVGKNDKALSLANQILNSDPYDDRAAGLKAQIARQKADKAETSNG